MSLLSTVLSRFAQNVSNAWNMYHMKHEHMKHELMKHVMNYLAFLWLFLLGSFYANIKWKVDHLKANIGYS